MSLKYVAGLTALAGLVACSPDAGPAPEKQVPSPATKVISEFELLIDPTSRTITQVGRSASGLQPSNIVQDGTPGSGPGQSVELVTTNTAFDLDGTGACGFSASFCGDVTVRSFYGLALTNVFVELTAVQPAAGHAALNSVAPAFGLSDAFGLWSYGALAGGGGNASRQWIFSDDGLPFRVLGRVMADRGTIAEWSFNEGAGNIILDTSNNGFHGTHNGTYVPGQYGTALNFVGTQQGIVPGQPGFIWGDAGSAYTISYWLNVSPPVGNWRSTVHKTTGGDCCNNGQRNPAHFLWPSTMDIAAAHGVVGNGNDFGTVTGLPANTWFHFAETHSGGTKIDYVNGVAVLTRPGLPATVGNAGTLLIAYDGFYAGLNGAMDELRVYGRALSPAEILADMNSP